MNKTWKAVLGVVLIFILGWLAGTLSASLFIRSKILEVVHRSPEETADMLDRRMTRNLDLDQDQRARIHEAFLANVRGRRQLQTQIQPQIRILNRQTLDAIDSVLKPDQRLQFQENLALFKNRFGKNPLNQNVDETSAATNATGAPAPPSSPP
jgi:hypothetical protein